MPNPRPLAQQCSNRLTFAYHPKEESLGSGYILQNQVTHARLLPVEACHSFTYPTLSLIVSLNALESRRLDLGGGWVFGYGGIFGRVIGLRPKPYLTNEDENKKRTIKQKLAEVLKSRHYVQDDLQLDNAWIMTMPSFMGFEGINPLTVYFCYKPGGIFWSVVLEIHNTFGESHVHILETGKCEDPKPDGGFDHQWTFLREFHVSPFNDRSGYYKISVKAPSHPPTIIPGQSISSNPKPTVRVHYHIALSSTNSDEPPKVGPLKLTAILRPIKSTPLTTANLGLALLHTPLALFLSMPRILYQAGILHYKKRLDVYLRPDPLPATASWDVAEDAARRRPDRVPGGVKWLPEGIIERTCRRRLEIFLEDRTRQLGCKVTLIPADPSAAPKSFPASSSEVNSEPSWELRIFYSSPRLFTILFQCPSPALALLLGCDTERVFTPSSRYLFLTIFTDPSIAPVRIGDDTVRPSTAQLLRTWTIPKPIIRSRLMTFPCVHPLDSPSGGRRLALLSDVCFVLTLLFLDRVEAWVFWVARARLVPGDEPWLEWKRAEAFLETGSISGRRGRTDTGVGSVLRPA